MLSIKRDEVLSLIRGGMTPTEVAAHLRCSTPTVMNRIVRGDPPYFIKPSVSPTKARSPEAEEIIDRLLRGEMVSEIAAKHSVSGQAIRAKASQSERYKSSIRAQRSWSDKERADLRAMWGDGLTRREIASRLNRSINSIVGEIARLHLERRSSPIKKRSG